MCRNARCTVPGGGYVGIVRAAPPSLLFDDEATQLAAAFDAGDLAFDASSGLRVWSANALTGPIGPTGRSTG